MGIYLARPSTSVNCEIGEGAGVEFAVGEMQGWRKHMEDAHIASPALTHKEETPVSLFGVFDGHGGKEVAKFTKIKYPDLLLGLKSFQSGDYEAALRESFHGIDTLLEDEQFDKLLKELRALPNPSDGKSKSNTTTTTPKTLTPTPSAKLPVSVPTPIVRAPSPDDSVDSRDDTDDTSPNSPPPTDGSLTNDEAVRMIQELLDGSRKLRKQSNGSDDESPIASSPVTTSDSSPGHSPGTTPSSFMDEEDEDAEPEKEILLKPFASVTLAKKQSKEELLLASNDKGEESSRGTNNSPVADGKEDGKTENSLSRVLSKKEIDAEIKEEFNNSSDIIDADSKDSDNSSSESKNPADDEGEEGEKSPVLHSKDEEEQAKKKPGSKEDTATPSPPPAPAPASIMSGGTLVCNLKDHRVLAGCTAVVALLVGKKLFVANAGDSRAVLMRNGVAIALSEDHKPTQERELNRIKSAGGYVNVVGRVNGNLNLSRSLGDLKYKQLKHLRPEEQIITAEPDVTVFDIEETDEFFILACDGIWDCLTNQQACDIVKAGLQEGHTLEEITNDVLKRCLADDPRHTQGIGGDNMTFLVVQFKH